MPATVGEMPVLLSRSYPGGLELFDSAVHTNLYRGCRQKVQLYRSHDDPVGEKVAGRLPMSGRPVRRVGECGTQPPSPERLPTAITDAKRAPGFSWVVLHAILHEQ